MIQDFLKKYQSELFDEKVKVEKSINDFEVKILEIDTFIQMLEKDLDSNYSSFSPLDLNCSNQEKILNMKYEKRVLKENLEEERKKYELIDRRFAEVNELLISSDKDKNLLISKNSFTNETDCSNVNKNPSDYDLKKLEFIHDLILQDPERARVELRGYINRMKK